jgi:hypothetical protein
MIIQMPVHQSREGLDGTETRYILEKLLFINELTNNNDKRWRVVSMIQAPVTFISN